MFILFHMISTTTITITSCFIVAQPSLHCLHILVRTFFMFYTIVYIKNINEMQCNIYYVYIIPSDATTITIGCFIVATTFSPKPLSPITLHPTVSFSSAPFVVVSFPPPSTPAPALLQIISSHASLHSST